MFIPTSSIAVRLGLTTRSNPPVSPTDANTGLFPQFWRGEDWAMQIGIFDPNGVCVDLSNLQFLEVDIYPCAIPPQSVPTNQTYQPYSTLPFPSRPPAPILSATIPAADITDTVTLSDWEQGVAQQAIANFSFLDTSSLDLLGAPMQKYFMVIHGITTEDKKLTYGGGPITVYEGGEQNIYLPNGIAPVVVPAYTILYVLENQQLTFYRTIRVDGTLRLDGTLIQIEGEPIMANPTYDTKTNTAGPTTIIVESSIHRQMLVIQGSPRTVPLVLSTQGAEEDGQLEIAIFTTGASGFLCPMYNGTQGGTLLGTFDNSGDPAIPSAIYNFTFVSGAWALFSNQLPAII